MANDTDFAREELLNLARNLATTDGESLTLAMVLRHTGLTRFRLFRLCGSWRELREAIALTPDGVHSRQTLSNEAIVEQLRSAMAQHGENITQVEFCQMTGYNISLLASRFGSWGQLRQLVGIAPRAKMDKHYSDQEIFDDLFQVVSRIHRPPTSNSYQRDGGTICAKTISDRFGGWQKALYALEDEMDRRSAGYGLPPLRYRPDPRNPRVYYVYQCGKPLYYIEYETLELKTGKKTPLPEGFVM